MKSDYSAGDVAAAAYGDAGGYYVAAVVDDDVVEDDLSLIVVRRAAVVAVTAFECSMGVLCLLRRTDDVGYGGCHLVGIDWTEPLGKTRRTRSRKTDETMETAV